MPISCIEAIILEYLKINLFVFFFFLYKQLNEYLNLNKSTEANLADILSKRKQKDDSNKNFFKKFKLKSVIQCKIWV